MTTEIVASVAYDLNEQIVQCNLNVRANFLHMAKLLVQMRDEKLYLALDCPTFESYLGTLGAEGTRGWLYKLIRAWELFSKKMEIPDQTLIAIGPSKLDILAPMVPTMILNDKNRADWIGKAANLSKSDLINEVRAVQGKSFLSFLPAPSGQINHGLSDLLLKYKSYQEYVKAQSCILCGNGPVDKAHFPRTKKRGGEDWQIIPLCRKCHEDFHAQGVDTFLSKYKQSIFDYFYGLILKIWEKT